MSSRTLSVRLENKPGALARVSQLFSRRGPHLREGIRELPISTTPVVRAPVIGTSVLALPALARMGAASGHFNLELHGIDALDRSDVPADIGRKQPCIGLAAKEKLRRLRAIAKALAGEAVTLSEAARRLLPPTRTIRRTPSAQARARLISMPGSRRRRCYSRSGSRAGSRRITI